MDEFAVIGLGQFGNAIARQLKAQQRHVLVVDRDREAVEAIADFVDAAICMNATDELALAELGLARFESVVVAMGAHSKEASILTTALLRQAGVHRIVARAADALHARILRAVGAHEVIDPEEEMGRRLADRLAHPGVLGELVLGDSRVAEVVAPKNTVGKTLADSRIRNRYGLNVLAVIRDDELLSNPGPNLEVSRSDVLVVLGRPVAIRQFSEEG